MAVDLEALRLRTAEALDQVRHFGGDDDLAAACALVEELRNARQYVPMAELAEAIRRRLPGHAKNSRLYGQALIELGYATAAIDLLKSLAASLPATDPEHAEATGLLGRAHKQIFFDSADKGSASARAALAEAIAIYRRPYEADPGNTWHGVNLVALLSRARRLGLRVAPDLDLPGIAEQIVATLNRPETKRDEWHLPTLAEASLGLGRWEPVEKVLKAYIADPAVQAFQVASTLRQFTQVWDIEAIDARGRSLADILRARLTQLAGGELLLSAQQLQAARARPDPPAAQLQAVLGDTGTKSWKWYRQGLDCAAAVCSIGQPLAGRAGTGWLVRAHALGFTQLGADECVVVTNFHVVNRDGADGALTPDVAEVSFEAVAPGRMQAVRELLWQSPTDQLDCTVLRLTEPPPLEILPLVLAKGLPLLDSTARVYVIGHPGGRELAYSLQDNQLLDHEGPPAGKPPIPGLCRVHYLAPTERGSSGSPVFNAALWQVIALHHKGGKEGMPRLNGADGSYKANEGIAIASILAAIAARTV